MSLQDLRAKTQTCLTDIYSALDEQGAEIPEQKNLVNVASAIESISGGSSDTPTITQLEYIESTGTQYINTEVLVDSTDLVVEIDGMFLSTELNYIAGATDGNNYYGLRPGPDTNTRLIWHSGVKATVHFDYNYLNNRLTYKFCKGDLYINDELVAEGTSGTINRTLYLFGRNSVSSADAFATCRIYGCKMYKGDTLIRDYIPALLNGKACLYDKVSGYYYENKGTGSFNAGPVII